MRWMLDLSGVFEFLLTRANVIGRLTGGLIASLCNFRVSLASRLPAISNCCSINTSLTVCLIVRGVASFAPSLVSFSLASFSLLIGSRPPRLSFSFASIEFFISETILTVNHSSHNVFDFMEFSINGDGFRDE